MLLFDLFEERTVVDKDLRVDVRRLCYQRLDHI